MIKGSGAKELVSQLLDLAEVELNGPDPWDVQVKDERLFSRLLREGDLAFGETYVDGWWECERIDLLTERIARSNIQKKVGYDKAYLFKLAAHFLFNPQTIRKSKKVAIQHYDVGNDLYTRMLDKNMNYSCGYWKYAKTLDEAQEHKLEMICQKLQIQPGMRLLDIGCGFGGMAMHAAKHHGAEVVGVTISKEQRALAMKRCQGLPVDIRLQDYRDLNESFDRIVSIGMFEHVGVKNYRTYMKTVSRNLNEEGLFLLHTIGNNQSVTTGSPWILKYIFPNSMLPSIKQIGKSIEHLFVMEDWHNFSLDYEKTLLAWHRNFNAHFDEIKDSYDERFKRMWNFYLLYCAGGFRSRSLQLWQILLSKGGIREGYPVRDLTLSHNKSERAYGKRGLIKNS